MGPVVAPLIVFDYQIFAMQSAGGISRYFVELIGALQRSGAALPVVLSPFHINEYLARNPALPIIGWRIARGRGGQRWRVVAGLALSRGWIACRRPAAVHETYYGPSATGGPGVPAIITIHDMIPERFAREFPSGAWDRLIERKRRAIARARHIICVSHLTRRDLLERYPAAEPRVSVVHHGFTIGTSGALPDPRLPGPYVLFVGERGGYKNFDLLLNAFVAAPRLADTLSIACFGGGAFTTAERARFHALGLDTRRLVQLGGDDDALATLYRHALALVYPSRYEGFGLPPLEAMAVGCPVVCSNGGAIPEVVGPAGAYIDPSQPESLAAALLDLLDNPHAVEALRRAGTARCAQFSWDLAARQTRDAYAIACA